MCRGLVGTVSAAWMLSLPGLKGVFQTNNNKLSIDVTDTLTNKNSLNVENYCGIWECSKTLFSNKELFNDCWVKGTKIA